MTHTLLKLTLPLLCSVMLFGQANAQDNQVPQVVTVSDTVTVQPGDTAYSLSRRAGLSVEDFLALNNLSAPNLKVGQVLILRSTPAHTVQAGETLYALSRKYGVGVDAIRAANSLPADAGLDIGQILKIPAAVTAQTVTAQSAAPAPVAAVAPVSAPVAVATVPTSTVMPAGAGGSSWRDLALGLMNTPYVWGGQNRSGTDCSGFVLQVFSPLGVRLPRQSADQARAGMAVSMNDLQAGDLLFFDTVGGGKVTHVGIYLGNDTFINANSYRGKVTLDHLKADKYWTQRYISARRVLPESILASQP